MSTDHAATFSDRLFAFFQQCLPTRALSALMFRIAEYRYAPFKDAMIGWFIRSYRVDMAEAAATGPEGYAHFNAFFTRALKPGARPQPDDPRMLSSPADGTLSQSGAIVAGRLLQAKGYDYTVAELLGDAALATEFSGGSFCTIYLAPHNYHRVHMPFAGTLRRWSYIPGRLFSVNPSTARALPRLFARNERMIAVFDSDFGPMAVVMVGALIVGGVETVWAGRLTPPHSRRHEPFVYSAARPFTLERGAELGRFHMGSTVILLAPAGALDWRGELGVGTALRLGDPLAAAAGPSMTSLG